MQQPELIGPTDLGVHWFCAHKQPSVKFNGRRSRAINCPRAFTKSVCFNIGSISGPWAYMMFTFSVAPVTTRNDWAKNVVIMSGSYSAGIPISRLTVWP